ncbi:MAG: P-loop NTPase [Acidimicrobiia bacterium]|nr:ParA family protein [Acidimicrobiia bacterium]NNL99013.1 P-loop NTPase [Acidimicrobiia bacterium]
MTEASIAIAASGREWALGLHRFVADHGGARVRVRVMHPEQAVDESYDVLVIDDITSFLSARLVQQVQQKDRKVLGIFEEPAGEQRLRKLGVNAVMRADAEPEAFVATIVNLAAQRNVDEEFAELIADLHEGEPEADAPTTARFVAVAGAGGGVGATEVAITLAADLRRRGTRVCLVDADDVAPAIAQRLDLPLHPNIRTAMDHLHHGSGSVSHALHRQYSGFTVLPGLPNVRDWGEIRSGDAIDVITELSAVNDVVLVNISSLVEQTQGGAGGEGRFGVARLVLGAADAVVLVAGPTPMAVGRVIEWLADTQRLISAKPLHVVVNRFDDGLFARGEIEQEIEDVIRPTSLTFTPSDPNLAKAAWEGTLAPWSGFSRAIESVTDHLTPARAPRTRRLRMGR